MKAFLQGLAGLLAGSQAMAARSVFEAAPEVDFQGGWGEGNPENLEFLTTHLMDRILAHLHPAEIASLPRLIRVKFDQRGPMVLYEGEPGRSPVVMLLSASDKYWAQYIYQFAHEFSHIACNFRRTDLRGNRFQWLEEAMCGAMALFGVQAMAQDWPFPQGHRGHAFGESLWGYLSDRRRNYLAAGTVENPRSWYLQHSDTLAETRELSPLIRPFSVWLYDQIKADPQLFASYRYMNLGSNDRSSSLTEHLLRWKRYCLPGRDGLPVLLTRALGDVP